MVEIICILDASFLLRDEGGLVTQRDEEALQPENYYILTNGKFLPCVHYQLLIQRFNRIHHHHQ